MATHIEHLEDLVFDNIDVLHNFVSPEVEELPALSVKWDGAPAIIFGRRLLYPHGFFMGTKSIFNKEPIVYETIDDIFDHVGDKPDLFFKLATAFKVLKHEYEELHNGFGIYQADLLYVASDYPEWSQRDTRLSFKANTVPYTVIPEVQCSKVKKSKIGLAIHTKYIPVDGCLEVDSTEPVLSNVDMFSDAVWEAPVIVDMPNFKSARNWMMTSTERIPTFDSDRALQLIEGLKVYDFSAIQNVVDSYKTFINTLVRDNNFDFFSAVWKDDVYTRWQTVIEERLVKEMGKVKTAKAKQSRVDSAMSMLTVIEVQSKRFSEVFELQVQIMKLKATIMNTCTRNLSSLVSAGNTGHEGFVFQVGDVIAKIVDRKKFSAANFQKNDISFTCT